MCNLLELSGLFVCLGGLVKFFSGCLLWGISTQADTMDHWSEDFKIGCIAVINWCNKLIFVVTNSGKITFILTHFQPLFLFYTHWKHQKTWNWKIGWKWVNNFRVLIVKDGCSHMDYRALKSTVSQEWMN